MVTYVVGECANCEQPRLLKYARRTMCCRYACQRAARALVSRRKTGNICSDDDAGAGKEPPTFCFEILAVYGQRDFDPAQLIGKRRRNEVSSDDFTISYLLLGRFAEDEGDDGFLDTRWVDVEDLMANLDDDGLKPLASYESALKKRLSKARARR